MTPTQARQAVYDRLSATDWSPLDAPEIVWANTLAGDPNAKLPRPRIEVQPLSEVNQTATIGGVTDHRASIALTVVVDQGKGEGVAAPLVDAIQARFPPLLPIIQGVMMIERLPDARAPLIDGSEHRVPVFIAYRARF